MSMGDDFAQMFARHAVDLTLDFAADFVTRIDAGEPITLLSEVHIGCVEVFGNESIRSFAKLRARGLGCSLFRQPGRSH